MIYNQQQQKCLCPLGKQTKGNRCIQTCKVDELLDANGNCYSCPRNMVVSNGQCKCSPGYSNKTGCGCSLVCTANQF